MATRTVVTRSRRSESQISREFVFTRDMIPALSGDGNYPEFLVNYRDQAWDAFRTLPIPSTNDEPWRRTDLRSLQAGNFKLPAQAAAMDLPPAPVELLSPLIGSEHGGQLVLLPGERPRPYLDPELVSKGVIFTDLATAGRDYPQQMEKILGKVVG